MLKVGYVGLGLLGAPVAACIARGGFPLTVYDISPGALEAFDAPGATKVGDSIAVAQASDIVIACVRTDEDVEALVGDGALFEALGDGGIFMIHSTIAPALCQSLAERAKPCGVSILDCGVSRGGGGAEVHGDLCIFLGGDADAVEKAKPLLDCLGTWRHLGPVGRGMLCKLLNNLVSIANYGMAANILELGEHLGFDRDGLRDMFMVSSAQGFAMRTAPGFVTPDRAPNMLALLGKDVVHARHLADPDLPSLKALLAAAQSMVDLLAEKVATQGQSRLPPSI
jgi:3-hydroxyisobutyrate dehydrogenase